MTLTWQMCLAPPDGSGDLNPRAVWPWAYTATGNQLADVQAAIAVYTTAGLALLTGAADGPEKDEALRQHVRYRALKQLYDTGIISPLKITTSDGVSVEMTKEQLDTAMLMATEAYNAFTNFLSGGTPVVGATFVPQADTRSAALQVVW